MTGHLNEAAVRMVAIETTAIKLALGHLDATPAVHAGIARLAQSAGRHLWVHMEEEQLVWGHAA